MTQAFALGMTLLIEVPLLLWLLRGNLHLKTLSVAKRMALLAAPTLVVHPFLWFASIHPGIEVSYTLRIVALELGVVLVEGFVLARVLELDLKRAQLMSLIVNTASCVLGLGLWRY
jgi:cytochrome bd-type quinol oxidase subunit 2